MAGVFTGGMVGGLLHSGWSLSRWVLCWLMHAINDMLVLMVLRGQGEATKKQYAGVLRQRAREREGESRRGSSVIAAATAAHAIRSLSALRFRHRQGPDACAFTCQSTCTSFTIMLFCCIIDVTTIEPWEKTKHSHSHTRHGHLARRNHCRNIFRLDLYQKNRLNIRTPPMRSKTTIMSGLCPKNNSRWIVSTSPARSSRLLPNQLGGLA